jgi:phosphonate transport system substrate-binding protein
LAKTKSEIEPFAALSRKGTTTYQGVVIGNVAAGVNNIADIAGKNMAYGDVASTSSHLIPKTMLAQKGLIAGKDYQEHFLGTHDSVALSVQNNKAQAGGLSKTIFESLVKRGMIDPVKVKILAESEPFPEYPWTMRSDLAPGLKEKIRQAFFNLKDPELLKPFKADGFAPIADKDYDKVRDMAKILNLDLAKMK